MVTAARPSLARLKQQRTVHVYRWIERMNRAYQYAPESFDAADTIRGRCGFADLLAIRLDQQLVWADNLEVRL
jgi:hypothetical protein